MYLFHLNILNQAVFPSTEGPRFMRILGFQKNRIVQNLCQWNCRRSPINPKIPHLHVYRLKSWKQGTSLVILCVSGGPNPCKHLSNWKDGHTPTFKEADSLIENVYNVGKQQLLQYDQNTSVCISQSILLGFQLSYLLQTVGRSYLLKNES